MSSDVLQITTQFTEHSIANVASPCECPICTTIIQPGEERFYLAPEGMPNAPGRHVCQPCMQHYLKKHSTSARVVPTAVNSSTSVSNAKNSFQRLFHFQVFQTLSVCQLETLVLMELL